MTLDFKQRGNPNSDQFVRGLGNLEIEDPSFYFEKMKQDLEAVKESLQTQRLNIMEGYQGNGKGSQGSSLANNENCDAGGVVGHIKCIKDHMRVAEERARSAKEACEDAVSDYLSKMEAMDQERARMANESTGKFDEYCSLEGAIDTAPACNDDLFDDAIRVGRKLGSQVSASLGRVSSFQAYCRRFNNERDLGTEGSAAPTRAYTIADARKRISADDLKVITATGAAKLEFAEQACGTATYGGDASCRNFNMLSTPGLCDLPEPRDGKPEEKKDISNEIIDRIPALMASYPGSLKSCADLSKDSPDDKKIQCRAALLKLRQGEKTACAGSQEDRADQVVKFIATPASARVASGEQPSDEEIIERWDSLGENVNSPCSSRNNSGSAVVDAFSQGVQSQPRPSNAVPGM